MQRNIEKCWIAVTQWVIKHDSLCQCHESQAELFWNLIKEWLTSAANNVAEFGRNICTWVIDKYKTMWKMLIFLTYAKNPLTVNMENCV